MKLTPHFIVVTLALACVQSISAQNRIVNGDFEAPPFAPSSVITSWNVSGTGHVHSISEGATSGTHSMADGTSATLSFTSVGSGNSIADEVVDTVVVRPSN